jgi:hypothetical protein
MRRDRPLPRRPRADGHGKHPADGAHLAVQAQLPREDDLVGTLRLHVTVGGEDAEGNGQIEAGAFLADVGGGEVDGEVGAPPEGWSGKKKPLFLMALRTRSLLF